MLRGAFYWNNRTTLLKSITVYSPDIHECAKYRGATLNSSSHNKLNYIKKMKNIKYSSMFEKST